MNTYARLVLALVIVVLGFGVVQAATVSRSTPSPMEPLASVLEREVAAPMRERRLGWDLFTRAGPRWDATRLRAVASGDGADAQGWTAFRLEAPSLRRPPMADGTPATEVVWIGRRRADTGAVELSRPAGKAWWRPLSQWLAEQGNALPGPR